MTRRRDPARSRAATRRSRRRAMLRYGVCSIPSFSRVCVHVVTVFSHGYFAATASSISTPSPGFTFAYT
ncbi:hypothetical protein C7S13_4704 [Burkholderia cepacia]|nr:hypothetical protein [Burkholderia cepacia]